MACLAAKERHYKNVSFVPPGAGVGFRGACRHPGLGLSIVCFWQRLAQRASLKILVG